MTNSENTSPEPTDADEVEGYTDLQDITDAEAAALAPEFTDTPATFTADLAGVATPYRYLNWVATKVVKAYSADLSGFSPERRAGIAALVDHGLLSERRWTGGSHDGRVTYRVTDAGQVALEDAWAAADAVLRAF